MAGSGDDAILLGFDAREMWLDEAASWGAEWKKVALLRRDIDKPLSIDRWVWPSLFDFYPDLQPPYTGPFGDLWEDLSRLEQAVGKAEVRGKRLALAAFAVMTAAAEPEELASRQWAGTPPPKDLVAGWSFVGYDVADGSATSALLTMRSAVDAADPGAYRARWAGHLNRAHLFDDPAAAADFKQHANQTNPKHAPFFVYGVWLIRES